MLEKKSITLCSGFPNQHIIDVLTTHAVLFRCSSFVSVKKYGRATYIHSTYIAVSYLSINRCLSGGRNRIEKNKERNYVCNKSKIFFFFSFFVVRQKTADKLVSH